MLQNMSGDQPVEGAAFKAQPGRIFALVAEALIDADAGARLIEHVGIAIGQPVFVKAMADISGMLAGAGADFQDLAKIVVRTEGLFQKLVAVRQHPRRQVVGVIQLLVMVFELPLIVGKIRLGAYRHGGRPGPDLNWRDYVAGGLSGRKGGFGSINTAQNGSATGGLRLPLSGA